MKLYIGEQLKALRKEKQITQEVLADVLGVSYQSVSRWELGVCYPDMELLPSIANYFGVTIDQLLSNDADSREAEEKRFYSSMLDSDGNEHEIYGSNYTQFCHAGFLHEFLTNPRWAWFDSVRDTERYREAVEWAKAEAEKEKSSK